MTDKKTPDSNSSSDKKSSQSTHHDKKTDGAGVSASISLTQSTTSKAESDNKDSAKKTKNTKPDSVADKKAVKQPEASTPLTAKGASTSPTTKNSNKGKAPISKTAIFAVLIALIGLAGVGGMYWLHGEQLAAEREAIKQQILSQQSQLNAQRKTEQAQTNAQVTQLFEQQSKALTAELSNRLDQHTAQSNNRIEQLEQQLARLQQNKSTDWLVHEAEYLIRIASRTLWLEKNTSTAINLLKDADLRLKELNDPQYLPVRQALRNDIESLQILPVIDNETLLLSINALSQQVNKLPLAGVKIPDNASQEDNLTLTDSTADWRENLAKTWRKFIADFITVRRISGSVEPLMSPQHQQNLRENLMLKLQVAQWAITKRQSQVYQQTLADITAWLNEYFDTTQLVSQHFLQSIAELQTQTIDTNYPSSLSALTEIRTLLAEKPLAQLPALPSEPLSNNEEGSDDETNNKSENN